MKKSLLAAAAALVLGLSGMTATASARTLSTNKVTDQGTQTTKITNNLASNPVYPTAIHYNNKTKKVSYAGIIINNPNIKKVSLQYGKHGKKVIKKVKIAKSANGTQTQTFNIRSRKFKGYGTFYMYGLNGKNKRLTKAVKLNKRTYSPNYYARIYRTNKKKTIIIYAASSQSKTWVKLYVNGHKKPVIKQNLAGQDVQNGTIYTQSMRINNYTHKKFRKFAIVVGGKNLKNSKKTTLKFDKQRLSLNSKKAKKAAKSVKANKKAKKTAKKASKKTAKKVVKKTAVKKTAAKKSLKKIAKKIAAKKTAVKNAGVKKSAKKAASKKTVKKSASKKSTKKNAKKTVVKNAKTATTKQAGNQTK